MLPQYPNPENDLAPVSTYAPPSSLLRLRILIFIASGQVGALAVVAWGIFFQIAVDAWRFQRTLMELMEHGVSTPSISRLLGSGTICAASFASLSLGAISACLPRRMRQAHFLSAAWATFFFFLTLWVVGVVPTRTEDVAIA